MGIAGVVVIVTLETAESVNRDLGECVDVHEGYNLTDEATLGTYTRFAVAVDNKICSTIGKLATHYYCFK